MPRAWRRCERRRSRNRASVSCCAAWAPGRASANARRGQPAGRGRRGLAMRRGLRRLLQRTFESMGDLGGSRGDAGPRGRGAASGGADEMNACAGCHALTRRKSGPRVWWMRRGSSRCSGGRGRGGGGGQVFAGNPIKKEDVTSILRSNRARILAYLVRPPTPAASADALPARAGPQLGRAVGLPSAGRGKARSWARRRAKPRRACQGRALAARGWVAARAGRC